VGESDLGFWMFNFSPQLRDMLMRATAVAGRAYARIFYVLSSLGKG